MNSKYKVGIIGVGRVGLPLALSFLNEGVSVLGFDINIKNIDLINSKVMPFEETGYDELIKKVDLWVTSDFSEIKDVESIVITVGTPLMQHIETDLSQINKVLNSIVPHIEKGHNIILRSTVAVGTTEYVKNYLQKNTGFVVGKDIFLSFCPERVAEGKMMIELKSLPQIIGSCDSESGKLAEEVFATLAPKIFQTSFVNAELTKLFNNVYRYATFAIANEFAMIAQENGGDIYSILKFTNTDYPRGGIPLPGFTAGTCLRKDFGMLNENSAHSDMFLNSWKVNEFLPKYLVDIASRENNITNKNVGILGYTFKKDTDDIRDSLVIKLVRYLEKKVPKQILIHEPHLGKRIEDLYDNNSLENVCNLSDIIFIGANHSIFKNNFKEIVAKVKNENCLFVDVWNISDIGKILFTKQDFQDLNLH